MTPGLFDDDLAPVKVAPLVRPGDDVLVPRAVLATLKQTLVRIRNWNPPVDSSKSLPEWLLIECGADVQLIDSLTGDPHEPPPTTRPRR